MDGALTVQARAERRREVRRLPVTRWLRVTQWPLALRCAGAVAAVAIVIAASPWVLDLLEHTPVMCPFRVLTGTECPGCGTTRAFFELGSGRPVTSLLLNPLGAFVWAYFLAVLATWLGVLSRAALDKTSQALAAYGVACAFSAWLATLAHRLLT
jgi:hypothetical protein